MNTLARPPCAAGGPGLTEYTFTRPCEVKRHREELCRRNAAAAEEARCLREELLQAQASAAVAAACREEAHERNKASLLESMGALRAELAAESLKLSRAEGAAAAAQEILRNELTSEAGCLQMERARGAEAMAAAAATQREVEELRKAELSLGEATKKAIAERDGLRVVVREQANDFGTRFEELSTSLAQERQGHAAATWKADALLMRAEELEQQLAEAEEAKAKSQEALPAWPAVHIFDGHGASGAGLQRYIRIECPGVEEEMIAIEPLPNGARVRIEWEGRGLEWEDAIVFERDFEYDHHTEGFFKLCLDLCHLYKGVLLVVLERVEPRRVELQRASGGISRVASR
mmetsp:Transcript_108729/g.242755  ORF Transcript_108729/g.242755 Transcript_108729/m.242755 type:complete len:348 (+) Transcript_108729:1-1044(+)